MPGPLSRRTAVLLGAGLGSALVLGCEDTASPGKADSGGTARGTSATPTRDPAEIAALRLAAGNLQTLVARYDAVVRRHPPLRARLTGPRQLHTVQLARLKTLGGTPGAAKPNTKAVPAAPAALAELAGTEQRLSVAHATAAAQRSGETARLLAMIAAGQNQIAVALRRKAG